MDTVKETPATGKQNVALGFVMFVRSAESLELLRDPIAFSLLATIAMRARWHSTFNLNGLEVGEALIGDHDRAGMTRGQYREATKRLAKHRFAAFRPTNKGMIAKLTSSLVFDINCGTREAENNQQHNQPTTNKQPPNNQPTTNEQPLTNKERKKKGKGNNENLSRVSATDAGDQAETIFRAYPRHASKKDAINAIKKALKKFPAQVLLDRTKAYAVTQTKNDRFTPYASTWFNKERFNDDPTTWTSNGSSNNGRRCARQFAEDFSHLRAFDPLREEVA